MTRLLTSDEVRDSSVLLQSINQLFDFNSRIKMKYLGGETFGKWTVIREIPRVTGFRGPLYCECRCECGAVVNVQKQSLGNGRSTGCVTCRPKTLFKYDEMIGKVVGLLTVERRMPTSENKIRQNHYECRCTCGNTYIVTAAKLNKNRVDRCVKCTYKKASIDRTIHGQEQKPIYRIWRCMIARLLIQITITINITELEEYPFAKNGENLKNSMKTWVIVQLDIKLTVLIMTVTMSRTIANDLHQKKIATIVEDVRLSFSCYNSASLRTVAS